MNTAPLTYAETRPRMSSGDVIALHHDEWGNLYDWQVQAVQTVTQSSYCHVAPLWVVGARVFVIESVVPLVRQIPLSNMVGRGFYWIPMPPLMTEAELEYLLSMVGVEAGEYSKIAAIKAQLNMFDIDNSEGQMECAKLTILSRRLSGVNLGRKATPSAVVERALELGYSVHKVMPDANLIINLEKS